MKVGVYAIALNEEAFLERWYESAKEADCVLLADTGSSDKTFEIAEKLGVNVYRIKVSPWRFDVAKNTALNLLPADIDIAVSLDLDEVLLPGWRKKTEEVWQEGATVLNHRYRHNGGEWWWHSKIHARHGCMWKGAVHETVHWMVPEKTIWCEDIYLDEKQNISKDRSRYLDLLIKKIEEGDSEWKTYYFLANEYEAIGNLKMALNYREKGYDKVTDGPVVKSYVAKNIASTHAALGNYSEAERWVKIGIAHSPERETLFYATQMYYEIQNWEECYKFGKDCELVKSKRDGYTYSPAAWGYLLYDYIAIAAYNLGKYEEALKYGKLALKMNLKDPRLIANLNFYKEKVENAGA